MMWSRLRIVLLFAAPMMVAVGARGDTSLVAGAIIGQDAAAHRALSADSRQRREAIEWLLQNGDRGSVAVLIQLLRWLPDENDAIVARLESFTGAHLGNRWFDWMVWQQDHPDFMPYPGYTGFLADLLASIDPRFR